MSNPGRPDPSLLPASAPQGEKSIESAISRMTDIDVPLRGLWNPYTCPMDLLPWLAWALSIDSWKSYWPENIKRERVAQALDIQRHKGTAQSVRNVIASFGGAVQLREWWQQSPPGEPHTFDMTLTLADANGAAATAQYVDDVIAEVTRTKPVRSHFSFTQGITAAAKVGVACVARPVIYRRINFEVPSA